MKRGRTDYQRTYEILLHVRQLINVLFTLSAGGTGIYFIQRTINDYLTFIVHQQVKILKTVLFVIVTAINTVTATDYILCSNQILLDSSGNLAIINRCSLCAGSLYHMLIKNTSINWQNNNQLNKNKIYSKNQIVDF